jgi:hypothetical protein
MKRTWLLLALAAAWACPTLSPAQFELNAPAAADNGLPPSTTQLATQPITIVTPEQDAKLHQITMPAMFWNPNVLDWVEVALSGRPGDFLHETVLAVTSTRTKIVDALHGVGFQDATAWVANLDDLPRIRGDRALILVEITRNGKTDTYLLDELISFQGWNTAIGPYGWMFKGTPGAPNLNAEGVVIPAATQKASPPTTTAPATLPAKELSAAQMILRDDPQFAVIFRGIQHTSQSIMDHPLAYDDWIYPSFRLQRNYSVLPKEILDSNGSVPVRLIVRKVTEAQMITESAKYWHDPAMAKVILAQLPIAEQIDRDKAALWALLPALRKRAALEEQGALDAGAQPLNQTEEFAQVAVLAAKIEQGYRTLDDAWTRYVTEHVKTPEGDARQQAQFENARKLWAAHMTQMRQRAEQLTIAEEAGLEARKLARTPDSPARAAKLRAAGGLQIAARSRALLFENAQVTDYWRYELGRLDADDPRQAWRDHITTQVNLAQARNGAGETGVALGDALAKGDGASIEPLQKAYELALLNVGVVGIKAQLQDVNFEISKREGMDNDPDLPGLLAQRKRLQERLKAAEDALAKAPATQAGK